MLALSIALPIIGLLLLVLSLLVFLYVFASFVVLWYDRRLGHFGLVANPHTGTRGNPKGPSWVSTFLLEYLATLLCVLVYPVGLLVFHPKSPKGSVGRRPVLLVHGLRHNQSAWLWHRRRLRRAGLGPIYTINLKASGGSIKALATQVADKTAQIEKETGTSDLALVGHSMGGLVCAYYAERLAPYGKVSRLVTLGTPLGGSRASILSLGRAALEMRPGSSLLGELEQALFCSRATAYYHLGSLRDNLVLPNGSAVRGQEPDREKMLVWQGHMTLLFSGVAAAQLIRWLKEPVTIHPKLTQKSPAHSALIHHR